MTEPGLKAQLAGIAGSHRGLRRVPQIAAGSGGYLGRADLVDAIAKAAAQLPIGSGKPNSETDR